MAKKKRRSRARGRRAKPESESRAAWSAGLSSALKPSKKWRRGVMSALRPPPKMRLSEWADAHFVLSAESSAEPGRWRTLAYQRGIMDAITDPNVERVSFMKSARIGYTKMVDATVGYFIHQDPCPIMVVQPTVDDAEGYSKEEIAPMVRDCAVLTDLVGTEAPRRGRPKKGQGSESSTKTSSETILLKAFPGGVLSRWSARTAAAGSVAFAPRRDLRRGRRIPGQRRQRRRPGQARRAARRVLLEPEDHRRLDAADRRRVAHRGALRGRRSPSVLRPLPALRAHGLPEVERRERRRVRARDALPRRAGERALRVLVVPREDRGIEQARDHRARRVARAGRVHGARVVPHLGGLQLVAERELVAARAGVPRREERPAEAEDVREHRPRRDLAGARRCARLGTALQPARDRTRSARSPTGPIVLTAGVDVQKDRFVYEVVGWGANKESWSIDAGEIFGDTALEATWSKLDDELLRGRISERTAPRTRSRCSPSTLATTRRWRMRGPAEIHGRWRSRVRRGPAQCSSGHRRRST
jgi:hypothetical protein